MEGLYKMFSEIIEKSIKWFEEGIDEEKGFCTFLFRFLIFLLLVLLFFPFILCEQSWYSTKEYYQKKKTTQTHKIHPEDDT
jgi:hypothetical protein